MFDVMMDEASLWFGEASQRKRKFEAVPAYDSSLPSMEDYVDSDDDMDPVEQERYRRQVIDSLGFDVEYFNHTYNGIIPSGWSSLDILFAKAGLHCYNIEKGKKLKHKRVVKVNAEIANLYNSYSTSEVIDPVDNSVHTFQALVLDAVLEKKAGLIMIIKICRIKPLVPESGDATVIWDYDAIDDFYNCDLPDWPPNDGDDLPNLYKVKDSELQENEWLYLYAEVALYCELSCKMDALTPFEMEKVMVQTKEEDVQSSLKLKAKNAIYYMKFKPRGVPWCRGIVRKTSDGRPGHMCLEARCWIDK